MKHYIYTALVALTCLMGVAPTASAADWIDMTSKYITNPGFDNNSNAGWSYETNAGSQAVRCEAMEFWQGTFNIWQTLKSLPAGHWRLSVQSYFRKSDNTQSYANYLAGTEENDAYMYAGETTQPIVCLYSQSMETWQSGCWTASDGTIFPNTMETGTACFENGAYWNKMEFDHLGGNINIGLRCDEWTKSNWCLFDNFKLEFYGENIIAQSIYFDPDTIDLIVGETRQVAPVFFPELTTEQSCHWTSSNRLVASVDSDGVISANLAGKATITAKTKDGSALSAKLVVRVSKSTPTAKSLVVNELMPSNIDQYVSPAYNFDGWAELYNPTDKAVSLAKIYLSDDRSDLKKWQAPQSLGILPAKSFRVIWFDSNELCGENAPFKLDVDGGSLFISDPDGKLISQTDYPASLERVSYARTTDGGSEWGLTDAPTPELSNSGTTYKAMQLGAPEPDQPSQLFSGTLTVTVAIPAGATLRYTTDGTLPTLTNGATSTSGTFSVSATTNYRFRLFADDYLASRVTSRSYISNDRDYTLPILSIVSDPDFLYDDSLGVMVKGVNGRAGNGQDAPCNWNMDWERPVNFSYIGTDGQMLHNQDVNLEMCGGWSRAYTPHSVKLKGNKELGGNKNLNYPFFDQKPYIRNRTLQVRNGGNDNYCRFIDPCLQYLIQTSGIDIDCQSYQPVHEFINGEYIGVLNMREPNNKHYVYANFGWDDDEIEQFEMSPDSGYVQRCGTGEYFEQLYNLSASAANADTYEEICQMLDIDEYINYMAACFYLGGTDWPQNNIKGFIHNDDGRFRFVLFDLDFAFNTSDPFGNFFGKETYTFDRLRPSDERITAQVKMVTIFKNLLQNNDFRKKFIDTYSIIGGSVLQPDRCQPIISELSDRATRAMQLEWKSPQSSVRTVTNGLSNRLSVATNALKNETTMQLSGVKAQQAVIQSDTKGAQIMLNGMQVPTGEFNGHLFSPITISTEAPAGYVFQGWKETNSDQTTLIDNGERWIYYDKGSLDGKSWYNNSYSTTGWKSGTAPLGYGMSGVSTTLSYGNSSSDKYPTYYLRKTFTLSDAPKSNAKFNLNYSADDGFIVYVNGTEAGRFNMPSGSVNFYTYSTTYTGSTPFTGTLSLDASLFQQGSNLVAVEVHNCSASSSDIYWDAQLTGQIETGEPTFYSNDASIDMPTNNFSLTASFRELTDQERAEQGLTPVRINEVSGSNSSLIDEYGKKGDWVELYNTTSKDIDLEGMYLTDNLQKPHKYQITKGETSVSTIIPAHGYKIIWCDKRDTKTQLHANFKIDGDGGVVAISAQDDSWTDSLSYLAHDATQTFGRYPDGTNNVYRLSMPTIAAANRLSSYSETLEALATDIATPQLIAAANGFRIRYGRDQLVVKNEDATRVRIDLYTVAGARLAAENIALHAGQGTLSTASLAPGLYIATATDEQGNRVSTRFRK